MAITASVAVRNSSATLNTYAAQAAMSISMTKPSERVALIVRNTQTPAAMTCSVIVSPGSYLHSVLGTTTVTIAGAADAIIGPLEGQRYKSSTGYVNLAVTVAASGTLSSVAVGVIEMP